MRGDAGDVIAEIDGTLEDRDGEKKGDSRGIEGTLNLNEFDDIGVMDSSENSLV